MTESDAEIVRAMADDGEGGFRMLLARYKEPVYWHIRRLVVLHDDAQDAAQETFVRIFRSFRNYDRSKSFAAWIYRIATNEALRVTERRGKCHLSLDIAAAGCAGVTADSYVDYSNLEAVKLQNAILSLPPGQQAAFNMRYYDGMGYDEIAEATGSTPTSVKTSYHIAKCKIKEYMGSHD